MKLTVASSPHIRGNFATRRIMADVMIALAPALAVGVARFGTKALILTLVCMASAVAAEWLFSALTRTRNTTVEALSEEERNVIAHFRNPAMPSVSVTADAAMKIASAREGFGSMNINNQKNDDDGIKLEL